MSVMDPNNENVFTLAEVRVSPPHNTLVLGEKIIKVQPKVMEVLLYLAQHHTRVISNDELMEQLWAGRIVTHGSVQKSINALRSAFIELVGEREIVTHYSKRGYQLNIEPLFLAPQPLLAADIKPEISVKKRYFRPFSSKWLAFGGLIALASLVILIVFNLIKPETKSLQGDHKVSFQSTQGYTNETGHERNAAPHPDNQHLAYIREKFSDYPLGKTESDILVRDNAGKDWRIATTTGSWFKLAWSPLGTHLVGVEVKRRDGQSLGSNFYEKPSYLYSFHIFTLDLATNRLLEKQVLSQWQGRIFSVTWWDESSLEIVAKQGPNAGNRRYRYSTVDQQLKMLDEIEGATNPLASSIYNKQTAVASAHQNGIQIDFLDQNQARLSHWQLDFATVDISWIPDGSGILIYAEEEKKLLALYVDGLQVQIPLPDTKDRVFSRPRFRPDGKAIYYTEEKLSANILLFDVAGTKTSLTQNTDLNYAASFSPSGEKIVYASVRNNQIHLWLIEGGQEHQLTNQALSKKVGSIIWSANGENLIFNSGTNLHRHNFLTAATSLLLSETDKIEPIAYYPETNKLLVIKTNSEARNLWRIDLKTQQQKQLTFGSVGSAIEYNGDVFFQYVSESGLWAMRNKDDSLEQVSPKLTANSKLLKVDNNGIYFLSGGPCRESAIEYSQFANAAVSTFMARENNIVLTTSFNVNKGVLQTECYIPEANIVLMK